MRWFVGLALAAGCGAAEPEAAGPGPIRAVSDSQLCTYHYDAAGRLVALEVDRAGGDARSELSYRWEGGELSSVELDFALYGEPSEVLVWANVDAGSLIVSYAPDAGMEVTRVDAFDAPVTLPVVLECSTLEAFDIGRGDGSPGGRGIPDRIVSSWTKTWLYDYAYTGVAARTPGTRIRSDGYGWLGEVTWEFGYDTAGRLITMSNTGDDNLWDYHFAYLDDGRPAQADADYDGDAYQAVYSYDELDRLAEIVSTRPFESEPHIERYVYE